MNNQMEMTLFQPEVVLPEQLPWGGRGAGEASGARALMLAILEDAMLCIQRGRRRRHRHDRQLTEAEAWVRCDSRQWLFSFVSICDVLGLDADALRARLRIEVESPDGGHAARAADAPSTRSGAVARQLPQRGSTRGSIAVDSARAPTRRIVRDRETRSSFGAAAQFGVA